MAGNAEVDVHDIKSLLSSSESDYLVRNNGDKVPISDLVGKYVLLYFSAHWCPPCRGFTPKLIETYHEIKAKHEAFEVIFISSDRNQASFDEYFSTMPWLALPFGDKRKQSLSDIFKVRGIPFLVALGPNGETITTEARKHIMVHGAEAFPFTNERLAEIEAHIAEMAKGWPNQVKHDLHQEHELVLTRSYGYMCDGCDKEGLVWSYKCKLCDFDLHPECAIKETKNAKEDDNKIEGMVCDGEVCYKAS